jgi:hypothetical protein
MRRALDALRESDAASIDSRLSAVQDLADAMAPPATAKQRARPGRAA